MWHYETYAASTQRGPWPSSTLRLELRISIYTYIYDAPKRYLDMHALDKVRDVAARHASSVVDEHILDF